MTARLGLGLREWGLAELLAGLRGACGLINRLAAEQALAQWFGNAYQRHVVVLNAGRSALQMAFDCLKAEFPNRTQVVLPALGCPALTLAVRACGLQPVYADIGSDLNTPTASVKACLGPRTLALVVVHAYGFAADVGGLSALCRSAGVALIDDSAQRVDPLSGLGAGGDFGVFSFAQSKSVVSGIRGSGGVLLVNDERYLSAITARYRLLPTASGRRLAWLEFLVSPHAHGLAYYLARLDWMLGGGATLVPTRIGALDASIALQQLATLETRRGRRLTQLQWYSRALCAAGIQAPQLPSGRVAGYLARLLVRVPGDQRAACRRALHAAGFATRLPYALPEGAAADSYPEAGRAAAELLELPLSTRLTENDVQCIVATLAPIHCASSI